MPIEPGTRLGPYEIIQAIGAGGMGEVYRARDTRLDRTVAIKVLPSTLAQEPAFRERFEREARTLSHIEHPHICPLYDVGTHEGTAYLVMQYLEGETLAQRLARGPHDAGQALALAIEICDALDTAHKHNVIQPRGADPRSEARCPGRASVVLLRRDPARRPSAQSKVSAPALSPGRRQAGDAPRLHRTRQSRTRFVVYSRRSWANDSEKAAWVAGMEQRFPRLKGRLTA